MKIVIEGIPIAKDRHRCGCSHNRKPFAYDPQVRKEMEFVRSKMLRAWNQAFDASSREIVMDASNLTKVKSFEVSFVFVFPINDREALGRQNAKLWGFKTYNAKPDFDNLEKFYSDCATGILWSDDSQVVVSHSKKCYDYKPRTEINIMEKKEVKINKKAEEILLVFGPDKLKDFLSFIFDFMEYPPSRIDSLTSSGDSQNKDQKLQQLSCLLAQFSEKYSNDLLRIKKFTSVTQEVKEYSKFIEDIKNGEYNI